MSTQHQAVNMFLSQQTVVLLRTLDKIFSGALADTKQEKHCFHYDKVDSMIGYLSCKTFVLLAGFSINAES